MISWGVAMAMLTPPPAPRPLWVRAIPVVLVLAAAAYWLLRDCGMSEEDRVRAVIRACEDGIERKHVGDVMEHIADGYHDRDDLSKDMLRNFLRAEFLTNKEGISIQITTPIEVQIRAPKENPRSAGASFRAKIAGGGALSAALQGDAWDFEVDFTRKDRSEPWRIVSHRRAPAR
jgi:hypothetical protein